MTDHRFHDGVYHEANRTNEANGRSWHIPDEEREPSNPAIFIAVMSVMIIGLSLCASVMP